MKHGSHIIFGSVVMLALLCLPNGSAAKEKLALARSLYGDTTAKRVGDLLTVIIEETSAVSRDASSTTSKKNSLGGEVSFSHPSVDDVPTAWTNAVIPAWSLDTSSGFEGGGSVDNSDDFQSRITVSVIETLPNGTLMVHGKRSVVIDKDEVTVTLSGTVRPKDVGKDNTVSSSSIADASSRYETVGPLASTQKKGLFTRFLSWVNPF